MRSVQFRLTVAAIFVVSSSLSIAEDWSRFPDANGAGIAELQTIPGEVGPKKCDLEDRSCCGHFISGRNRESDDGDEQKQKKGKAKAKAAAAGR
jgi:hypothetical protein